MVSSTLSLFGGIFAVWVFALALSNEYQDKERAKRIKKDRLDYRRRQLARKRRNSN